MTPSMRVAFAIIDGVGETRYIISLAVSTDDSSPITVAYTVQSSSVCCMWGPSLSKEGRRLFLAYDTPTPDPHKRGYSRELKV